MKYKVQVEDMFGYGTVAFNLDGKQAMEIMKLVNREKKITRKVKIVKDDL